MFIAAIYFLAATNLLGPSLGCELHCLNHDEHTMAMSGTPRGTEASAPASAEHDWVAGKSGPVEYLVNCSTSTAPPSHVGVQNWDNYMAADAPVIDVVAFSIYVERQGWQALGTTDDPPEGIPI